MAATISVAFASNVTVTSTLTGFVDPLDDTWTINGLNESYTLTASSSVPATKATACTVTMSVGAATIDLTALAGVNTNQTVDLTGLKVQALKAINPDTNANKVEISKGASNGYGLGASGDDWSVVLSPGMSVLIYGADTCPDVASGAKTIDVAGTGSQTLEFEVVAG